MSNGRIGVFGGGLAGCCTALALAKQGVDVDLIERADDVMCGASLHNEGKLHLGYVYALDRLGRTHELMARGSLAFLGIIEHLTGAASACFHTSAPFIYGVPDESRLDVSTIAEHFKRVDATIQRISAEGPQFVPTARSPTRAWRLTKEQERAGLTAAVQASFQTEEISVDTEQVAQLIRRAVRAHDRIRLHLGCHVQAASYANRGGVHVRWLHGNEPVDRHYRYGINCVWEDRLRLDGSLGIVPRRPWIMRYKAALTLRLSRPVTAAELPSITLVSGPFGDVVNHDGSKLFASWYPLCKLAESHDIDGLALHATARAKQPQSLAEDSLQALARFVPRLAAAAREAESVAIGGGVIFAWGATDIHDPKSGLHERHAIGATLHRDWASMDTGKYCMAPYYAVALAELIAQRLS
jgi:glycine/D-amino acid oxidase-like deaminating enzyme